MTRRPYRVRGTGPVLDWHPDLSPARLRQAAEKYGPGVASLGAATLFAIAQGWVHTHRTVWRSGDVSDFYATERGPAVVVHTQGGHADTAATDLDPEVTVDRLPAPWVTGESWDRGFTAYVIRRVAQ